MYTRILITLLVTSLFSSLYNSFCYVRLFYKRCMTWFIILIKASCLRQPCCRQIHEPVWENACHLQSQKYVGRWTSSTQTSREPNPANKYRVQHLPVRHGTRYSSIHCAMTAMHADICIMLTELVCPRTATLRDVWVIRQYNSNVQSR